MPGGWVQREVAARSFHLAEAGFQNLPVLLALELGALSGVDAGFEGRHPAFGDGRWSCGWRILLHSIFLRGQWRHAT